MPKKNTRNTRGRIISAAWKLFYENGYEDTTIEDIINESGTSRGSFYHYFEGKTALLGTLSYMFDEKYEELKDTLDPGAEAIEKLLFLNHELFTMIENRIPISLLSQLLSTQLLAGAEKNLLDQSRTYFKLLRKIITEGQQKGEIRTDISEREITRAYALWERALLYDWCLENGKYPLVSYADKMMPVFLGNYRAKVPLSHKDSDI